MSKVRRRWWVKWLIGSAIVVAVVALRWIFPFSPYPHSYFAAPIGPAHFRQNRATYEAIISEVRASGIKAGEARLFKLISFSNPSAMRQEAVAELGTIFQSNQVGDVYAAMTADSKLKVSILTYNQGDSYGYTYSEVPLHDNDIPGGQLYSVLPQLDTNWWGAVYYDY